MQPQWSQWLVVWLGLWVGLSPGIVAAQDTPPVSAADVAQESAPPERMIYLPYKNLRAVFEKEAAAVFVPLREYLALWEKTRDATNRPADQSPVAGVITRADYSAKVEQDVARIQATLTVQVLNKGWAEIPIKFGNASIGNVSSEPPGVLLRGTGQGTYTLLLSQQGEIKVQLELATRVLTSPEGRSLELLIPTVAVTNFKLTVPEADQAIDVQPKLLQQPAEKAEKSTSVNASLGSVEKVTASWHPRVGTKPDMELLASATSAALVQVEDGLIHSDVFFHVEVLRGKLERLRVAVPKGHRILDVASEVRIKEWKVAEEAQRQVVTVEFLSGAGGKLPLEIHTERALGDEPFDAAGLENGTAHGIHLLDVLRESGQLALRSGNDLVLSATTQQGLVRIDESEVDQRLKRPGASFYKFYSPQCRLTVSAKPVEPRLLVEHQADVTFTDDQLKLDSQFQYTVERAGVFELTFKLPEGLTVENVICDGLKQFDVSADRTTLTVALKERRIGAVHVRVTAVQPRDSQAEADGFNIPLLEPNGVEIENGKLRIKALDAIDVITETDQIVGFQPDPAPVNDAQPPYRLVSAWTFNRRPVTLPVKTVSKPTRLTADIGTTFDVKQGQTQATVDLTFHVEYAGLDTFRFSVPEPLADGVQINLADSGAPPIKQKSRSPQAVDGWVIWTVVLQREMLGDVRLKLTYDLIPDAGSAAGSETYKVALVRVLEPFDSAETDARKRSIPLSRIAGEVTVRKDRALSVAANATGGDVEPIDVRELTKLAQDGFVAFRYFKQPIDVEITAAKYEVQDVVATVVSRGLVEVVLDRAGGAMFRCRYLVKTSERQRLRLDLPANADPLGTLVDRKPVALEKDPAGSKGDRLRYFVNVARTKSSDETFSLAVLYRVTMKDDAPFQTNGGAVKLWFPIVGGDDEQQVALQQLRVVVWVPEEYALVGAPDQFTVDRKPSLRTLLPGRSPQQPPDNLQGWIGDDAGGMVDFPTEGQAYSYTNLGGRDEIEVSWWHMPFYTWIISGALVLIALVLLRTSWENKLTMVLLAAFFAAAYALKDADTVLHGLMVASYGLAVMAGLWLIHALFGRPRVTRNASSNTPPGPPPAAVIPPPGVFDSVTLGLQKPQG